MPERPGPRVVAIGGGHGLATTLRATRRYAGHLTAVVATGDDGGSSGRVRAQLDMPAPGDLRRCLTTLAADRSLARDLEHRFGGTGDLAGHAVGNLVLAGLVDAGDDLAGAAARLSAWLGVDRAGAQVLPATVEPVSIIAATAGGMVRGQVAVEDAGVVDAVALEPPSPCVPEPVLAAVDAADQIVIGPGSFVTSVLATVAVPALRDALASVAAPLVLVANLREPSDAPVELEHHLQLLAGHGVDVDQVLVDVSAPAPPGSPPDVVTAPVARPHGLAHDDELLSDALAGLLDRTGSGTG